MNSSKQPSSKEAAVVVEPSTSTSKAETGQESLTCAAGGDNNLEVDNLVISQNAPQIGEEEAAENLRKTKAEKSKELRAKVMGTMGRDLILESIAKHLPAQDLSNIRGTCVAWNQKFVPELKKKHSRIVVVMDPELKSPTDKLKMDDLMAVAQSSTDTPFTNYYFSLEPDNPEHPSPEYLNEVNSFNDFITRFGNTITKLELILTDAPMPLKELRRVIFECTPQLAKLKFISDMYIPVVGEEEPKSGASEDPKKSLPYLKKFKIDVFSEVHSPSFRKLVMDVIQSADNLDHLNLDLYDLDDEEQPQNMWMAAVVEGLRDTVGHVSKIKTLKLCDGAPIRPVFVALNQLATRGKNALQLESFSVTISFSRKASDGSAASRAVHPDEVLPLLHAFLVTQEPTLKDLHLECDYGIRRRNHEPDFASFCMPPLKHLQKLKISNHRVTPNEGQFEGSLYWSGSFMATFPALTKFIYEDGESANELALAHSGVTDFQLLCRHGRWIPDFPRFGLAFPSLSRLDFQTVDSKDTFERILSTWPALKRLSLKLTGGVLNSFLSGVSIERLNNLREEFDSLDLAGNLTSETLASLRTILDKYKTRPGVSDLKLLQDFRIESSSQCELTDLGGYFGIALASSTLQRVVIGGRVIVMVERGGEYRRSQFVSEECRAFVQNVFGPCAIIDF